MAWHLNSLDDKIFAHYRITIVIVVFFTSSPSSLHNFFYCWWCHILILFQRQFSTQFHAIRIKKFIQFLFASWKIHEKYWNYVKLEMTFTAKYIFFFFSFYLLYKRRHICMQISLTQLCECVCVCTLNLYSKTWDHMQIYYLNF